jgi:hypothetical protein
MSFSQHLGGESDGHWQSNYLGKHGVIARDERRYVVAKAAYHDAIKFGHCVPEAEAQYRDALLAYASTVYSARMFRPVWAPRMLIRLVAEIEAFVSSDWVLISAQKEPLMAYQMYLAVYDTWWTGEIGRNKKAAALGQEILIDENTLLATRLFTMSRMSNIRDYVTDEERKLYRDQVLSELKKMTDEDRLTGLDQGWKTVCRLGMLVSAWEYVDLALKHDRSRDLRLKAWVQPGFVWHKLIGGIFGG